MEEAAEHRHSQDTVEAHRVVEHCHKDFDVAEDAGRSVEEADRVAEDSRCSQDALEEEADRVAENRHDAVLQ